MRHLLFALAIAVLFCGTGCPPRPVANRSDDGNAKKSQATSVNKQVNNSTSDPPKPLDTSDRDAANSASLVGPETAVDATLTGNEESALSPDKPDEAAVKPERRFSAQRIVILTVGGPRIIELQLSVAGDDLKHGLATAADRLAGEVSIDWQSPPTWIELLEKPLIRSGWLGNLVPNEEQRSQVLSLYDTDGNSKVDIEEFKAFITRGLSRSGLTRVVKARSNTNGTNSATAWGPLDENADSELSKMELENIHEALERYDYDGDRIISFAEIQSSVDSVMSQAMGGALQLLESTKVVPVVADKVNDAIDSVFDNYTFTETIPRDAFSQWSDERFKALDADADEQLEKRELKHFFSSDPDAVLLVEFADSLADSSEPTQVQPQPPLPAKWVSNGDGGKLGLPGCSVTLVTRDAHDAQRRSSIKQILTAAVDDSQSRTMISAQLELKEGAFELLSGKDEAAINAAWRWIASPRDWHVTVTWTVAEDPWFQLLDGNGDQRIVETEIARFADEAAQWDTDGNGVVGVTEMPLGITLTVARDDRRPLFERAGGMPSEKRGGSTLAAPSWFLGMDYNSDGEVTRGEFLGEEADFAVLDKDEDGAIELAEVYRPH